MLKGEGQVQCSSDSSPRIVPLCARGAVCRAAAQILFKRTQFNVNNQSRRPASSAFLSYKQVHGVCLSPLSSSDTPGFSLRGDGCGSCGARSDSAAPTE